MRTVLTSGVAHGATGEAVTVKIISSFMMSCALGVTIGYKIVVFGIIVPVVEVHKILDSFSTVVPKTVTFVASSQTGA